MKLGMHPLFNTKFLICCEFIHRVVIVIVES
jgi:hypothetical protein